MPPVGDWDRGRTSPAPVCMRRVDETPGGVMRRRDFVMAGAHHWFVGR